MVGVIQQLIAGGILPLTEPNVILLPVSTYLLPVKATCMFWPYYIAIAFVFLSTHTFSLFSHMEKICVCVSFRLIFNMYVLNQQPNLISNIGGHVHMDFPRWSCFHHSFILCPVDHGHMRNYLRITFAYCESGLLKAVYFPSLFIPLFLERLLCRCTA